MNGNAKWLWAVLTGLWVVVTLAVGQIYKDLRDTDNKIQQQIDSLREFTLETRNRQSQALIERKFFNQQVLQELEHLRIEHKNMRGK